MLPIVKRALSVLALGFALSLTACGGASQVPTPDPVAEEQAIMEAVRAEIARTDSWSDLGCHMTEQRVRFLWARGQWAKDGAK